MAVAIVENTGLEDGRRQASNRVKRRNRESYEFISKIP